MDIWVKVNGKLVFNNSNLCENSVVMESVSCKLLLLYNINYLDRFYSGKSRLSREFSPSPTSKFIFNNSICKGEKTKW